MNISSIHNQPFFCSWSGGKDSCLAFYRAIQAGGIPKILLTMLREEGERTRSHGLTINLVHAQARSLGIPLQVCPTSRQNYEDRFLTVIRKLKKDGITHGVFGDIDLEAHLEWTERVCSAASIQPCEPLWKEDRRSILNEFMQLGFKASFIAVKKGVLSDDFLGREVNPELVNELEQVGVDLSGEEGEYHTVVTDGPIFSFPIELERFDRTARDGYHFLNVSTP